MKIISWNVNGLRAIKKKQALQWIDSSNANILCLQETKLVLPSVPEDLFKKYFSSITINNSLKKGFSGTCIYSDIPFNKKSYCLEIDSENDGRIIEQYYGSIVLLNVYVPNGKLNQARYITKLQFLEKLLSHCDYLRQNGFSIIICGDFNIAHKDIDLKKSSVTSRAGFSNEERSYLDEFIARGYLDTYRYLYGNKEGYTWWSYRAFGKIKNEGWRIDYIFISEDLKNHLTNAFILDHIEGSDHCPVGIELNLKLF